MPLNRITEIMTIIIETKNNFEHFIKPIEEETELLTKGTKQASFLIKIVIYHGIKATSLFHPRRPSYLNLSRSRREISAARTECKGGSPRITISFDVS